MAVIIIVSIIATLVPNASIYNSLVFKGLLFLLIANTTLCTIKRVPGLLSKIRNKTFEEVKKTLNNHYEVKIQDIDKVKDEVITTLNKKGYRTIRLQVEHEEIIWARKGFLSLISNLIVHIALIIILIGAFFSSFGFEDEVIGSKGHIADIPGKISNDNLKIRIDDFSTLYNTDNSIENWQTSITVFAGEREVSQGKTIVNKPFKYQGVTIYQNGYGFKYLIELESKGIKKQYEVPVDQAIPLAGHVFILEKTDTYKLSMTVYESYTKYKTYELQEGTTIDFPSDIKLKFLGEVAFTILKVKNDPGVVIVVIGLTILSIGFIFLYMGQYHEIKVKFDGLNKKAQISVTCKSKSLNQRITNELLHIISGR